MKYSILKHKTEIQILHKYGKRPLGVNFINILSATFSYQSALRSFSLVAAWLCNFFGAKIFTQKLLIKC